MKMLKRVLAGTLCLTMLGAFTACDEKTTSSNTSSKADTTSKSDDASKNDTSGGDKSQIASEKGKVTIKMSWWGGESRHNATQAAVDAFEKKNPNITVETQFSAWDGWESTMSTAFYAGTAPDVNQINWNWITSYSSDGKIFADMNKLGDYFDLTQYDKSALDQCTVADKLQGIPVSMTGRIFYWNKSTFEKAGISTPTSYAELLAAGETFKTKLGDDYYPIALGEYDRMILMVYYLESVYNKPWVENGKLNYTKEEIAKGMEFLQELENKHVTPSIETLLGDGAKSLDKNPKWMSGKYAGIFEWDSSAPKFGGQTLEEGNEMVVGDYFSDFGSAKGGYSKVSLAFAVSETSPYKEECAMLLDYLLNDAEGTALMASERGIPLSKSGLKTCTDAKLLDSMVAEANQKVLAWVSFPLDPKFEDSKLKGNPDGTYYEAIGGLSYGDYSVDEAADVLIEGINKVLKG